MKNCILCQEVGGTLLFENNFIRVINANDPHYPGFTRVILQRHEAEMSDLPRHERQLLMEYVFLVEQVQRETLHPDKINLAQFGTMVPHIHWHIIPRFKWDLHYPASVWSTPTREANSGDYQQQLTAQAALIAQYQQALITTLQEFISSNHAKLS